MRIRALAASVALTGLLLIATACSDTDSSADAPSNQSATTPTTAPPSTPASTSDSTPTEAPSADPTGTPDNDPTDAPTVAGTDDPGLAAAFCKEFKASDASVLDPAKDKGKTEDERVQLGTQVQNLAADAPTELIPPMQVLAKYYSSVSAGTFNTTDQTAVNEFTDAQQVVGKWVADSCAAG